MAPPCTALFAAKVELLMLSELKFWIAPPVPLAELSPK
jgi:hypothetical protein